VTVGALAAAAQGGATGRQSVADGWATRADTGTLSFDAQLAGTYPLKPCPAGTPSRIKCFARTAGGVIPGLGGVNESFDYIVESEPPGCDIAAVRLPATTAVLTVPGKGEIDLRIGGTPCLFRSNSLEAQETFTIAGGSGIYAGASGGGTYTDESGGPPKWGAKDTWAGKLVVPGLDFDLTPPVLNGANNRTTRLPKGMRRVRVAYSITAQDAVDSALPVTCRPRSASLFRIGRTRVRCSATDTSGNETTAAFVVIVKRSR
jgi:hypothetical protein